MSDEQIEESGLRQLRELTDDLLRNQMESPAILIQYNFFLTDHAIPYLTKTVPLIQLTTRPAESFRHSGKTAGQAEG
jgi:hypothetical protein